MILRNLPAARRPRAARRRGRHRPDAGPARAPRPVAHLPEPADLLPHDRARERHGRPPSPRDAPGSSPTSCTCRRSPGRTASPASRRWRRSRVSGSPAIAERSAGSLALWRSQAAGNRARARERAEGAAARRAGGRLQSGRDRGTRRRDPRDRRGRRDRRAGRARHAARHEHLRPHSRARQWRDARRGHRGGGARQPGGDRGLSRRPWLARRRHVLSIEQSASAAMAASRRCMASRSRCAPARSWRWSARTAPARPRCCARSRACSRRPPARSASRASESIACRRHRRVALGIAQVPEGRQLFTPLSVEDNLRARRLVAPQRRYRRPSSPASTRCSRCSTSCATPPPARCRAASSRCSRSAGR